MDIQQATDSLRFLAGGGEMGKLTREKDWSKNLLGPPEQWQQSLRTTLSIILNSKFPMFLFWGKDLVCFYNDAYRPSLGKDGKHPSILGMRGEDAWPEIWVFIKPLIDQVLAGGEASWSEDQLLPIYRNGALEDVYWTFSYSPVNDESGKPAGVFVTCSETTGKIMAYKKLAESKDELEFAIEATELGTWDYNPVTNQFSSNDRLKKWFGLAPEANIELTHAINAIRESERDKVAAAIAKALDYNTGGTYDIEYTIVHPVTKKETIVHAKGRAWFDDKQVAYRFNGTLEEVTDEVNARKQIETSESRFRSLINQSPMAMAVFRGPGQVIEIANSAMLKRWNKSAADITNKKFIEAFPEMANERIPSLLDQVYKTGKTYRESEAVSYIRDTDGNKTYIDFEYSPLLDADGNISGVIATVSDVTEKVNSRKKIEESEARYHSLIYTSPSAIAILYGEDLVVTIANDAIIGLWGKGKEIIGKPYFEALPELVEQGYQEVFRQVYITGIPFNAVETPVAMTTDQGVLELRYYNFLLFPQRNIKGDIEGIGIIATEVTSQALLNNKVKESEIRFRLLADSMPQHIWTSDPDGNLNYFNQSVYDYSGLTEEEINKDGWLQIVHPDDRKRNAEEWMRSIKTGKNFLLEHRFRKYDGEYRWQLSRAVPHRDANGTIQMWVGTSTDIQEQKTFADELEHQVQERTAELEQNNIALEKMNKELQSFAYISSHDLQEPLRKIRTFSDRIMEKEYANLSSGGRDYFARMQNAALRMQTLIDDLLSYSRTNTAEKIFEESNLGRIVDEVRSDLQEEIAQKYATVEAGELPTIRIIPFQFRQLVFNLISNSLKFSSPDRPPHISITASIAKGATFTQLNLPATTDYCRLRISDNGVGFDQEYSERIFGLFQRLHARDQYHGTGVGLAIVKKIVENHDGYIVATSKLNEGATFDIYLPVKNY